MLAISADSLDVVVFHAFFFFSSRRRHTRWNCDWSSDVCSSDLLLPWRDAHDVGRLEAKLAHRALGQREVEVAVAVRRLRPGAVQPELDLLLHELVARSWRVDAEVEVVLVVAVEDALHHAGRPVQRP